MSSRSQPCGDGSLPILPPVSVRSARQRHPKLGEKASINFDHGTRQRLEECARRLGVHYADLVRAFVVRGLQQAEAARDA